MTLINLKDYARLRRGLRGHNISKSISKLTVEARRGNIPGAFQMTAGGEWLVDLEYHDKMVFDCIRAGEQKAMAARANRAQLTPEEQAFINKVYFSTPAQR